MGSKPCPLFGDFPIFFELSYIRGSSINMRSVTVYVFSCYAASDMSVHVRKYARYLGCYAAGYKVMALDVCRVAKG